MEERLIERFSRKSTGSGRAGKTTDTRYQPKRCLQKSASARATKLAPVGILIRVEQNDEASFRCH